MCVIVILQPPFLIAVYIGLLTSPEYFVSAMSESDKSRAAKMALHCQMPKIAFNSLKLVDQPTIDKFSVLLHHCKTVTTLDFTGDIMDDKVKTMVGEMFLGTKIVSSIRHITADFFSWHEKQTAIELPNKALRPPGFVFCRSRRIFS